MAQQADGVRRTSDWPEDAAVEAAAQWASAVHRAPGSLAKVRTALGDAAARAGLAATLRVLRSLPVVDLPLGRGATGTELRRWFGGDARVAVWDRGPVAVLQLPATTAEYLSGRPRQALRTNVTRARKAGLTCTLVTTDAERRASVDVVARLRHQDPAAMVLELGLDGVCTRILVARTAEGEAVGLAELVLDGQVGGLATLVTAPGNPAGAALRSLLHLAVVEHLLAEDVRTLVVSGSMLLTAAGTRYHQRRTGFVPARVRLVETAQPISARSEGRLAASPGWSTTPGSASGSQATSVLSRLSTRPEGSRSPVGTASTVV
ncbi:hypothetical protein SAMN05660324_0821 [Klenkia brasiliensis]|uniref:Acetyltransferase (GNAT) domain-containing protein n=1 Tax=Klenkia brasiliensis TaxID=333142 RepID=A0A1G7MZN2_9ACTN|nr:hypothetical protein SAMN05660324_0821 [Klenkia brasiliensis]